MADGARRLRRHVTGLEGKRATRGSAEPEGVGYVADSKERVVPMITRRSYMLRYLQRFVA